MTGSIFNVFLGNTRALKQHCQYEFGRAMRTGRMIAFVGSFATEQLGYPRWSEFLIKTLANGKWQPDSWMESAFATLKSTDGNSNTVRNYQLLRDFLVYSQPSLGKKIPSNIRDQFLLTEASDEPDNAIINLCRELGITRFVTTNYDLEFEYLLMRTESERALSKARLYANKWFMARNRADGVRIPPDNRRSEFDYRIERITPDGRRIASDVLHRERPDRLYEFAIGSPDYDIRIMHLHGRITDLDTMIVGQADYDRRYRRSGLDKLPFEHALATLFAGNPVLFVGLGMNEGDFLASLERFVSDDRPGHIAPSFAIWNAKPIADGKPRKSNEVTPDDELLRLRLYQRFGTYLIFDVELEKFEVDPNPPPEGFDLAKLGRGVRYLAEHAADYATPFQWERKDFRSMQDYLPNPSDPMDSLWRSGSRVWPVASAPAPRFDPGFAPSIISPSIVRATGTTSLSDDDYLAYLLRDGSPVKLFLDKPGTGHGYLASVIRKTVTREFGPTKGAFPSDPFIYFQINAGFAWEIDTTFGLVSGLYDSKTAYATKQSRTAAISKFVSDFEHALQSSTQMPRRMIIAINGIDRFFDANGYPLSNELDMLLRQLNLLSGGGDQNGREQYVDWVRMINGGHPAMLLLFGTNRIGRYFEALRFERGDIANGEVGYYDILGTLPAPFEASEPAHNLHQRIVKSAQSAGSRDCPLDLASLSVDEPHSVFLRNLKASYSKAGLAKLPTAARAGVNHGRRSEIGNMRFAMLDAYLAPANLAAVMPGSDEHIRSQKGELTLALLKAMALIGQPTEATTLILLKSVKDAAPRPLKQANALEKFMGTVLVKLGLISQIECFPGCTISRFGLHRAMLQDLRDRYTVPISDARTYASFNLPLLAAQPIDDHEPEREVHAELEMLFDTLVEPHNELTETALSQQEYTLRLRAAMSSLRSYYTTSSLLMHDPQHDMGESSPRLEAHASRLEQLGRRAEVVAVAARKTGVKHRSLFPDDLVWLQDQRGVALLAQGNLYGARDAFAESSRINSAFVEFNEHHQNWRRIEINQVHVDIERGKLSHAEGRIRSIEQSIEHHAELAGWRDGQAFNVICERYGSEDHVLTRAADSFFPADLILSTALCLGYKAWCEYFRGRLKSASMILQCSLKIFRNLGEQRAYAMFLRHQASLFIALKDENKAIESLTLCIAASDSSRQMDISHLAWLARGDYQLVSCSVAQRAAIQQQFNASLRYAETTGMYRVRMEARRSIAKMRFASGDYDGALEQASDAVAIASRFGFSLRKLSLRIMIGQILIRRGDPISGNAMIDQATRSADRIGYQRAVEQAHQIRIEDNRPVFEL